MEKSIPVQRHVSDFAYRHQFILRFFSDAGLVLYLFVRTYIVLYLEVGIKVSFLY
jgi:hypothetical protein